MKRLLAASVALTMLGSGVARAHVFWDQVTMFESVDSYETCDEGWLAFGDGDNAQYPGGQMKIVTEALASSSPGNPCDSWWVRPKGDLANHAILFKDDGDHVDICKDGGLAHSSVPGGEFKMQWTFKHAPCGLGSYFESGQADAKDDSGSWIVSPWIQTPDHVLR